MEIFFEYQQPVSTKKSPKAQQLELLDSRQQFSLQTFDSFKLYSTYFQSVDHEATRFQQSLLTRLKKPPIDFIYGHLPHILTHYPPKPTYSHRIRLLDHSRPSIVEYMVSVGFFVTHIKMLVLQKSAPELSSKVGRGGFSEVLSLSSDVHRYVAKRIKPKQSLRSSDSIQFEKVFLIHEALIEYSFYKICDDLEIGPKVESDMGFDIVCFEDCIEFYLERCDILQARSFTNQDEDRLKYCVRLMHAFHMIHKDIKPQNILYSPSRKNLVLTDFGISSVVKQKPGERTYTYKEGTPSFMGLEMLQIGEQGEVDLYLNDAVCLAKTVIEAKRSTGSLRRKKSLMPNSNRSVTTDQKVQYSLIKATYSQIYEIGWTQKDQESCNRFNHILFQTLFQCCSNQREKTNVDKTIFERVCSVAPATIQEVHWEAYNLGRIGKCRDAQQVLRQLFQRSKSSQLKNQVKQDPEGVFRLLLIYFDLEWEECVKGKQKLLLEIIRRAQKISKEYGLKLSHAQNRKILLRKTLIQANLQIPEPELPSIASLIQQGFLSELQFYQIIDLVKSSCENNNLLIVQYLHRNRYHQRKEWNFIALSYLCDPKSPQSPAHILVQQMKSARKVLHDFAQFEHLAASIETRTLQVQASSINQKALQRLAYICKQNGLACEGQRLSDWLGMVRMVGKRISLAQMQHLFQHKSRNLDCLRIHNYRLLLHNCLMNISQGLDQNQYLALKFMQMHQHRCIHHTLHSSQKMALAFLLNIYQLTNTPQADQKALKVMAYYEAKPGFERYEDTAIILSILMYNLKLDCLDKIQEYSCKFQKAIIVRQNFFYVQSRVVNFCVYVVMLLLQKVQMASQCRQMLIDVCTLTLEHYFDNLDTKDKESLLCLLLLCFLHQPINAYKKQKIKIYLEASQKIYKDSHKTGLTFLIVLAKTHLYLENIQVAQQLKNEVVGLLEENRQNIERAFQLIAQLVCHSLHSPTSLTLVLTLYAYERSSSTAVAHSVLQNALFLILQQLRASVDSSIRTQQHRKILLAALSLYTLDFQIENVRLRLAIFLDYFFEIQLTYSQQQQSLMDLIRFVKSVCFDHQIQILPKALMLLRTLSTLTALQDYLSLCDFLRFSDKFCRKFSTLNLKVDLSTLSKIILALQEYFQGRYLKSTHICALIEDNHKKQGHVWRLALRIRAWNYRQLGKSHKAGKLFRKLRVWQKQQNQEGEQNMLQNLMIRKLIRREELVEKIQRISKATMIKI